MKMFLKRFRSNRYFFRIFIFSLIGLLFSILLISIIFYKQSSANIEEQFSKTSTDMLGQIQSRVDSHLEYINRSVRPLLYDTDILKLLNEKSEPSGIELMQIQSKLNRLEQSVDSIESVYLNIADHPYILGHNRYFMKNDNFVEEKIPPPVTNGHWQIQEAKHYKVITYTHLLPNFNVDTPKGYLNIHLRPDIFKKLYETPEYLSQGKLVVVDSNYQLVSSIGPIQLDHDLLEEGLNLIRNSKKNTGQLLLKSQPFSLYYLKSQDSGWYSILFMPNKMVNPNKIEYVWTIAFISVIAMLFGSILNYFNSKKIYSPINQWLEKENYMLGATKSYHDEIDWLKSKWESLKLNYRKSAPDLRRLFLINLLNGKYTDQYILRDMLIEHGFSLNKKCISLLIEIHHPVHQDLFNENDEQIIQIGITHLIDEFLQHYHLNGEHLTTQDYQKTIHCLLYFSEDQDHEVIENQVHQFCHALRTSVNTYYKTNIIIGMGNIKSSLYGLRESYIEAKKVMNYQILNFDKGILTPLQINIQESKVTYPKDISDAIVDSIMKMDKIKSEQLFTHFVQTISKEVYDDQTIRFLFISLYHDTNQILKNIKGESKLDVFSYNMYEKLQTASSISDIEFYFLKIWFPYCYKVINDAKEKESSGYQLIETAKKYIDDHIKNDLSLHTVAEVVNLNPSYFSRLFSQYTGESFTQYVTIQKVNLTKKLLLHEQQIPIREIANQIGYTEQTLRRAFKNITGMTPSEYRNKYKK